MDPTTLLREKFAGGHKLVTKLLAGGADLLAACWAKIPQRETWRLFLVIPGEGEARRKISLAESGVLDELEGEWTSAFERVESGEVSFLSPTDPLAKGLIEFATYYPRKVASWKGEGMLGDKFVEGAYIYPSALFAKPAPATGN